MRVLEQEPRHGQRRARSVLWGVFGVALAVVLGTGVIGLQQAPRQAMEDDLRPFGIVPEFTLRERSDRLVTRDDLQGKVWIAGFIFTRCVEACPLVSARMARLQEALAADTDLRLVSITVDPEHDTPEVLSRYAQNFGAHPERWLFLTGDRATIYRLARDGFRLGVVDPHEAQQSSVVPRFLPAFQPAMAWAHHGSHASDQTRQAILHSARLVLVDRQGQIRQYYDSKDDTSVRRVQDHARRLLRERLS